MDRNERERERERFVGFGFLLFVEALTVSEKIQLRRK